MVGITIESTHPPLCVAEVEGKRPTTHGPPPRVSQARTFVPRVGDGGGGGLAGRGVFPGRKAAPAQPGECGRKHVCLCHGVRFTTYCRHRGAMYRFVERNNSRAQMILYCCSIRKIWLGAPWRHKLCTRWADPALPLEHQLLPPEKAKRILLTNAPHRDGACFTYHRTYSWKKTVTNRL